MKQQLLSLKSIFCDALLQFLDLVGVGQQKQRLVI